MCNTAQRRPMTLPSLANPLYRHFSATKFPKAVSLVITHHAVFSQNIFTLTLLHRKTVLVKLILILILTFNSFIMKATHALNIVRSSPKY